jgi:hypothetical protein
LLATRGEDGKVASKNAKTARIPDAHADGSRNEHNTPRRQGVRSRVVANRDARGWPATRLAAQASDRTTELQARAVARGQALQRKRTWLGAALVAGQVERATVKLKEGRIEYFLSRQRRRAELATKRSHSLVIPAVGRESTALTKLTFSDRMAGAWPMIMPFIIGPLFEPQ